MDACYCYLVLSVSIYCFGLQVKVPAMGALWQTGIGADASGKRPFAPFRREGRQACALHVAARHVLAIPATNSPSTEDGKSFLWN